MSTTWKKCLETLKDTVPVGQFSVWIKPLKAQEKNHDKIKMKYMYRLKDWN
jgi:chromosomal replication initiator protein